jgi:hypothetical protein
MRLDEFFGQEHKAKSLRPLGDDISDDLAPLRFRIDLNVKNNPCCSYQDEKHRERMVSQDVRRSVVKAYRWPPALRRSLLIEMLGRENHHNNAQPVGDRISEERPDVRCRIRRRIQNHPHSHDRDGRDA